MTTNATVAALLAQTASDWKAGAKDVIFICIFLLVAIVAAVWWLRRG